MNSMYKLSVIIPIYNGEKYLPECLESLAAQSIFGSMQVILVNDGSTDGSGRICSDFAAVNRNAVFIDRQNGGVSAARNAGLDAAEGEYIGFIDSDDTVAPDYYERLLNAADENGCDMAFGGMTFDRKEGRREAPAFCESGMIIEREDIPKMFAGKMLRDGNQNSVWSKVLRKNVIQANHIRFPVGIKIAEDKLFVLEFLKYCQRAVCVDGCGYFYRDVQESAMHSKSRIQLLLAVSEAEVAAFTALGLDEKNVRTEKSYYIFEILADYLQRELSAGSKLAAEATKEHFENTQLMQTIDIGLNYIKSTGGTVYRLLAGAFGKRSVPMTLAVLKLQKFINRER